MSKESFLAWEIKYPPSDRFTIQILVLALKSLTPILSSEFK